MKSSPFNKSIIFFVLLTLISFIGLLARYISTTQSLDVIDTKTPKIISWRTPTPTIVIQPSPWTSTPFSSPTATNTPILPPFPAKLIAVLPKGVTPKKSTSWSFQAGCGQILHMIPYQLSDGYQSLAVIEEKEGIYKFVWDLQQADIPPIQWQEILAWSGNYIPENLRNISFMGLDKANQWWIGYFDGYCEKPALSGFIPVSGPKNIFYIIGAPYIEGKTLFEYWVVDQGKIFLYHQINGRMVKQWSVQDEFPGKGFVPVDLDLTGDGDPERLLRWWQEVENDNWATAITKIQLLQTKGQEYRFIGEVLPGWQRIDIDHDNVGEFLRWQPAQPKQWDIYKWNGNRFDWKGNLARPIGVKPHVPNLQALPSIPIDLYYLIGGVVWRWPREGGPMQPVDRWPEKQSGDDSSIIIGNQLFQQVNLWPQLPPSLKKCKPPQVKHEVVSWSPDCRFALVNYYPYDEGYQSRILNPADGTTVEIPNSFVYTGGYSIFAWDPLSQFIIHARTKSGGLYQIDLPSGHVKTLVSLSSDNLKNWHEGFGAGKPFILKDGSILFTIQGIEQVDLYPPPGVYRLFPDGQLKLLLNTHNQNDNYGYYDSLNLSPDESMFIYDAPSDNRHVILLGLTDGSDAWDLSTVLEVVKEFRWGD
ncbi:MAG: hypothetical protein HS114_35055 [Anaerolineales bacterium]|nr:hypothetical protein [Anaerolineales bacterium]